MLPLNDKPFAVLTAVVARVVDRTRTFSSANI
jgi:hypothetical protein